jgi:hypothetical protein
MKHLHGGWHGLHILDKWAFILIYLEIQKFLRLSCLFLKHLHAGLDCSAEQAAFMLTNCIGPTLGCLNKIHDKGWPVKMSSLDNAYSTFLLTICF